MRNKPYLLNFQTEQTEEQNLSIAVRYYIIAMEEKIW